ncbi:hypothetical protein DW025_04875 [Coprococcus sp. AF38-1]|nr:hypothetical protein DW025_04875 [Coprococcus sp. AF38-1]
MIHINIEIQKPNHFRDIFKKTFSKLEDFVFSIIQRLPDKLLPSILISWLNRYTDKRISELQHQIIQNKWRSANLNNAVDSIKQKNNHL